MIRGVFVGDTKIEYTLIIKKVKNINLKVLPSCDVVVSANKFVNMERIDNFVKDNISFIQRVRQKYMGHKRIATFISDDKITLFDQDYDIEIKQSTHNDVELFQQKIVINLTDKTNEKIKNKIFNAFLLQTLQKEILGFCDEIYPYFENKNIRFPQIKFRKMSSRWGSCNYKKGIITFNSLLVFVSKDCIKYVVAHEFSHFIYPNHSKYFYLELANVFPNWKETRAKLKSYAI